VAETGPQHGDHTAVLRGALVLLRTDLSWWLRLLRDPQHPAFHTGELVILRQQSSPHVGEVAGYHDKMLGVVVMHQIVGRTGKRFIFKGENNSFDDPYEPVASGIVGAEWIHIPRIGFVLRYLRDPWVAAVIFPMLWLASFGEERTAKHSRKRSLKRSDSVGEPELAGSSRP